MGNEVGYIGPKQIRFTLPEIVIHDSDDLWNSLYSFASECVRKIRKHDLDEQDFTIMIPKYIMCMLDHSRKMDLYMMSARMEIKEGAKLFGMPIKQGYENKYICFYKEYPYFNGEGSFFEGPLPPVRVKD